jgi:hypothetical protein
VADGVVTPLARALLEVDRFGTETGVGVVLVKYRASGTTIMPTMTVRTNVTAPHSRRMNAQFTSGEY